MAIIMTAPVPAYITGVSSFTAVPGFFYRVDTSAGPVTANLPAVAVTQPGDWLTVKNISGANIVTVAAFAGEYVDAATTNLLASINQRRWYFPGVPAGGYYPAPGWVSL